MPPLEKFQRFTNFEPTFLSRFSPGDNKVPQHKSCKKRLLQAEKANAMNRSTRSAIRTALKAVRSATSKEEALKAMPALFSMLDKAAAKGRAGFCANRVANYKAKAAKVVNGLA